MNDVAAELRARAEKARVKKWKCAGDDSGYNTFLVRERTLLEAASLVEAALRESVPEARAELAKRLERRAELAARLEREADCEAPPSNEWWNGQIEALLREAVEALRSPDSGARVETCSTCGTSDPSYHGDYDERWEGDRCPDPFHKPALRVRRTDG